MAIVTYHEYDIFLCNCSEWAHFSFGAIWQTVYEEILNFRILGQSSL